MSLMSKLVSRTLLVFPLRGILTQTVKLQHNLLYGKQVDFSRAREDLVKGMKPRGERGNSEFFRNKMMALFRFSDANKDGRLTWDDFEVSVAELVKCGGLSPEESSAFKEVQRCKWDYFFDLKGVDSDKDYLTEKTYLLAMREMVNIPEIEEKGNYDKYIVPYFFKAVDLNCDGRICLLEYVNLFKAHGMTEQDAAKAFKSLDANSDGEISFEEFCLANMEYMFSENEDNPCKEMFGPIEAVEK